MTALPQTSDINLFGNSECVINLHSEVSDGHCHVKSVAARQAGAGTVSG